MLFVNLTFRQAEGDKRTALCGHFRTWCGLVLGLHGRIMWSKSSLLVVNVLKACFLLECDAA